MPHLPQKYTLFRFGSGITTEQGLLLSPSKKKAVATIRPPFPWSHFGRNLRFYPSWCGFPCHGATCDFIGWSTLLHAALSAGGLVGPYWTISRTTKMGDRCSAAVMMTHYIVSQWYIAFLYLAGPTAALPPQVLPTPHTTTTEHRTKTWVPRCCSKIFWDHLWSWDQLFWTAPPLDTLHDSALLFTDDVIRTC